MPKLETGREIGMDKLMTMMAFKKKIRIPLSSDTLQKTGFSGLLISLNRRKIQRNYLLLFVNTSNLNTIGPCPYLTQKL